jgi:predicted O-linked N-acetylglucosamine transferase (SPINDLY family)
LAETTHDPTTFHDASLLFKQIIDSLQLLDYLLIGKKLQFPKKKLVDTLYKLAWCYKYQFELLSHQAISDSGLKIQSVSHSWTTNQETLFQQSLQSFNTHLQFSIEFLPSLKAISNLFSIKALLNQSNYHTCLELFKTSLSLHPTDPTTHYNIAFIFFKLNHLNDSLYHYKLSIKLNTRDNFSPDISQGESEMNNIHINSLYGIACVYATVKQWPMSLYYLLQASKIKTLDPDIHNKLGIVYTELRRTDLAEKSYFLALQHYNKSVISTDLDFFHAEINLNIGHMYAYNGDILKSISFYNKALSIHPTFLLAFQNKIMNLNYLCHDITNGVEYIFKQHTHIQKLLPQSTDTLVIPTKDTPSIIIGLVSGDFVDHPVSFFIQGLVNYLPRTKYKIICYSESVVPSNAFSASIESRIIKNLSDLQVTEFIRNDHVSILFDLSGHTALNRIGVFSLRAAPIQISYIGYPNTTGITNMDFRITDHYADNLEFSQPFYTEKLLPLDRCFLNYNSPSFLCDSTTPIIQPFVKNGYITFGCFNRLNKITSSVITLWISLLSQFNNSRILFKTKALINSLVKSKFLSQFNSDIRNRIDIIDCTVTHSQHLDTYNLVDISIDTFPYSGTTTTCESLSMGVPVVTLRDSTTFFHAQNVTTSILHYSGFNQYILDSLDTLDLAFLDNILLTNDFKITVSKQFKHSNVCDNSDFITQLDLLLQSTLN